MSAYLLSFKIVGEVADMLLLDKPERRLLVDISPDPALPGELPHRRYPNRATLTITDPEIIARFMAEVGPGDVTEASGTFSQSSYVPHRTTCIDTTFVLHRFQKLHGTARPPAPADRLLAMMPKTTIH